MSGLITMIDRLIGQIEYALLIGLTVSLTLILSAQVVLRYFFSSPLFWAEEVAVQILISATIIAGVMTPTEAGAVASIMAFVIGAGAYKAIRLKDLGPVFASVALNTATITGLIATASVFGWALSFEAVPDMLVEWISGITTSPILFLMLVYVLVILLGMFLESISVMIVIVPIILPAALSFGIDPIHFGVIISLATLVGLVTPPVGPGLYIAMTAANLPMGALFRAMVPFLLSMFACMLIIALFPAVSLWLPGLMAG